MEKNFLTTILILTCIISCNQKKTNNKIETNESTIESKIKIEENQVSEQYFENDSLRNLLISDLDRIALTHQFELKTESIPNTHNKAIIDTIKTQTFEKNKILSYLSIRKEWVYCAEIRSSEFILLGSIRIGTEKQNLEKILKTQLKSDLVKIGDLEDNSVFSFIYKENKLTEINYRGYLD